VATLTGNAAPALLNALQHEALTRAATAHASPPKETIQRLVQKSNQPELQADKRFDLLEQVAGGNPPDLQTRFAEVIAEALTQARFSCTQPLYRDYLDQRYGMPASVPACADELPFLVLSRGKGASVEWLDIHRVKEIGLVFASASDNIASRFGHVSLRLTVCPKGSEDAGACDRNLYEHISLGFLAQVDGLTLNTLSALTGKYRAYLFARPFMDTYDEYAVNEFRDLYVAPLRLDAGQRERLLRGLAQIHWQFEGEYRFFGNNCASMLQAALRTLLPEYAKETGLDEHFIRPDNFFAASRQSPWINGSKLADLRQAEREGYFFSSASPFYAKALETVRQARPLASRNMDEYLLVLPKERQLSRKADARYTARLRSDRHLREAEMLLEQYAMLASERTLISEGGKLLQHLGTLDIEALAPRLDASSRQYLEQCFLAPLQVQFQPVVRYTGIPARMSLPAPPALPARCETMEGMRQLQTAFGLLVSTDSQEWAKLQGISQYWADTVSNIKELGDM
jgi:hypothetical protein